MRHGFSQHDKKRTSSTMQKAQSPCKWHQFEDGRCSFCPPQPELDLVDPKAVPREPKKVRFLLQDEIPDEELSHGKRKVGRISSQIRHEAEENGVKSRMKESDETVEEEREMLVRTTRSRTRTSLVGDVTQFPIVGKRKTRNGCESELNEEKGNSNKVKAVGKAGESLNAAREIKEDWKNFGHPGKANELTEIDAQPDKVITRSKRNVSKLAVSAKGVGRVPVEITVEDEENGMEKRNKERGAAVEEEQEMLVRATRSRTLKSLVGDAIQFPIVEKRKTRYESQSEINMERDVNGDREEKKKLSRVMGKMEVGESSDRFGENVGDLKKSGPLVEANELEIHAQPGKGMRRSRRNASKLAASAPADAERRGGEVGRVALQSTVGSEGTGVKSGRKECDEIVEKEQEMLVRTTRSHAQKLLAGDVTQFPIVEKKKMRKGSESEIDEEKDVNGDRKEKKKRGRAKAMRGVGEISNKDCENGGDQKKSGPRRGENELAEMPAQPDNGTRRSKRNISTLAVSAPADTEMPKDEVARVPSKIMVEAQETRAKRRKMESDEPIMEKQEKLVRATRSCSQKSVVHDVTQFPIVEKRRTRKGTELQTDKEKIVNGNGEEKRNLSKVKTMWEVRKNSKDGEIEATQMHSQPEKAVRRSKRNVPELAVSVAEDAEMEKDEIVTKDEPRKRSRNKILEVVDSVAECGTGFDNETEVTEETVAENRTIVENDLEAVDELQGQSKSTNGNWRRKQQRNLVADGAAVGGPKRSKCPISSGHHGRSFTKVAEGELQRNSMCAYEEAAEISITDDLFDPDIGNLSRNCTDCGLPSSVDGMVAVDSRLDTAEVVDFRSGTTETPTELSHRHTEVVNVAKSTEAVSACKGDREISGAEDVRIIPQVNFNEVVELAQIQEADPEVAREASETILDAGKVDFEVRIFGDSLGHNQEKGAEEFAHVRDNGILLQFDGKETQLATPVSIASCLHDVSHIDVNDNQGNTIFNVLEMAEECETMKSPSSGQQVSFGDDGLASCAHISPECVVEYHGAFDHKDQLEFTDGSDKFIRTVLGDCKVTPNQNGIARDCSEESDHDCAQEENSFSNGVCSVFSKGLVETAMPELGFAEIEEFEAGYESTQTILKQFDSKSGIEYGEDAIDTTGQLQEASETIKEEADQGCETDIGPSDISEQSKERNVRTVVENGGNMNAQGNEKMLSKYDSGDERFENSVAVPSHLDLVEEGRTDEKLSSGRNIYLEDDGLASCTQTTPESFAERHCASDHKGRIIDGFAETVTLVRGDCEVIPSENGITQGIAGGSDHEDAQEESAVLNEICGVEYGSTRIVSEQCDAKNEGNGDDAKDNSKEEFHEAPETIMEDVDWVFKIGMELKVINQEVDGRNEKRVEDNAGDVDEKENAEVDEKYDDDERSKNSVASPNLLDMVEESKIVENPFSGQKINLENDSLVTSTHITPEGVVEYHCAFGHKDQLKFAGVVDGSTEKVTHELIHGDFEVITNDKGISKGNTEKSDCEDAQEEIAFANEISGVEYGSTLTISEHCDSKGSEENGDDVRNIHSVVSEEFQEDPENIMEGVDGEGCKTGVELNDNCKEVEERNVNIVEDITGYADEKENVVMSDKYEDDESFENFVANPNLSDVVEECNTVGKSSSGQKIVVGDDGLSSFTKIVVGDDGLAKICTPISELSETSKPELGSVKLEEISLECRSIQTISKESDADGAEENGEYAKVIPGIVLVEFQEVSRTARAVADQDCKVDAELEDNSGNVEIRNATTIEVEGEDAYEKENAESFMHNYGDHEKSENSVAVTHEKSEVLDFGGNAEMVAFGVCAFSPLGAPKPQGVSDREVRVTDTTIELSSEATIFFSDHDVRDDAVKFVQGTVITAEEVEDEPSLNCVGAEANCEKAQEVSETNENKSALQEEVTEASDATDNRLEHQVEVVTQFALEKLECEDHDETVGVKGQEEGFMSDEEGKTMENIQKEECTEVMNKTSKDKGYEDTRDDILRTEDHQLLHEDNCEEIKKRENYDCRTGNLHCNREVIYLQPEEPLEVQYANKMTVDMFALGTPFPASVNAPEFQDCMSSKKQSTAFGSHASPNVNAMGLDVENFNLTTSECLGINQEEVPGTSILAQFGCENYVKEGSANSLRGTMMAVDPVENKSPVICEGAEMSGKVAQEVSGSKEIEYSFWKEIGEASDFEGTLCELEYRMEVLAHFAPEKLDCKDHAETEKMKGSSELVLEEPGNNSFEEVTVNEEVEKKEGFSCDYTQVVHENECFEAMEEELKCRAHNSIDKEMASILGDECNYNDSKEYSEKENPESEIKNSDCKESNDAAPVKREDPLEVQGLEEMNADVGAVGIVYLAPSGGAEYEASYTNFEEQSSSQILLPTDSGEEESTEIQVTELPDKPSSKSTDCTNENYDSEVEGSLVDEAEATPVSTGEEEHLADSSRLEISVSFETKDVMCEKGSSEHEEELDTVSALKETVEEGLVSANFKESLDSEVMAQFTEEKEIVDILEGKFDRDDAKDVAGANGSVEFSPQEFDFAGSEGVFLPKVALAPSPDEDFKDPTEFTELQVFAETSSSLQHEVGANSSSILTALEHLVSGNEHERELASIVDAAANITSPMTDSINRNKASYVCKEQERDGQEENGNTHSSLSRHAPFEDVIREATSNLIGSGNLEVRVGEVSGLLNDMWISTVQVEKRTRGIGSQKLKSVESLKFSSEMKENTPVVKQVQLSDRSLGKSATSVCKRRALQDLKTVKEQ
ncbi:hypothetical protein MRB53_018302 [Persea americana]|uniref:Uncharacterized protein n=1 Tax=Persea americana TaxID=3435 RepID=A0ACC2M824_PERAE|nr:hypothetical protein MRB53_018302 [Persea americana]